VQIKFSNTLKLYLHIPFMDEFLTLNGRFFKLLLPSIQLEEQGKNLKNYSYL
jgi:hypothetical protein